jgi:multiple sugar transport system ATP-binding protein
MTLADRIVVLNEGKVVQAATPTEIYRRPATRFVATFVGSPTMNLLPARIMAGRNGTARIEIPGGAAFDSAIPHSSLSQREPFSVGLRPEHVGIASHSGDAAACANVLVVERLGERTLVHVQLPTGDLLVAEDVGLSAVRPGESVGLTLNGAAAHLFDAEGHGFHAATVS